MAEKFQNFITFSALGGILGIVGFFLFLSGLSESARYIKNWRNNPRALAMIACLALSWVFLLIGGIPMLD